MPRNGATMYVPTLGYLHWRSASGGETQHETIREGGSSSGTQKSPRLAPLPPNAYLASYVPR
jgi:hypothetical protein